MLWSLQQVSTPKIKVSTATDKATTWSPRFIQTHILFSARWINHVAALSLRACSTHSPRLSVIPKAATVLSLVNVRALIFLDCTTS